MRYYNLFISSLVIFSRVVSTAPSSGSQNSLKDVAASGRLNALLNHTNIKKDENAKELRGDTSSTHEMQYKNKDDENHDGDVEDQKYNSSHDDNHDLYDDNKGEYDDTKDKYDDDDALDILAENDEHDGQLLFTRARPLRDSKNPKNSKYPQNSKNSKDSKNSKKQSKGAGDKSASSITSSMLRLHNAKRRLHHAPPMLFSAAAENAAKRGVNCRMAHSRSSGENIAWGSGNRRNAIGISFNGWYNEKRHYNYGRGVFSSGTGHFTQVVWKGSRGLGCAQKNCGNGWAVSCVYIKSGNMSGQFKKNVQRP